MITQEQLDRWKARVAKAVGELVPGSSVSQFCVSTDKGSDPNDTYVVKTKWLTLWDWYIVVVDKESFVVRHLEGVDAAFADLAAQTARHLVQRRARKAEQLMPGVPADEVDRIRRATCPIEG